ncbi:spore germination protein [Anaerobacillus sp. MEB173]|uniref:spore germination protein n=1 Tax=Anaerobacillus sp. MEB173 TaxID=3383345 RepID=UPI003F8E51F9
MPAIVGAIKVISIGASSVFNVGDVLNISPNSTAKTFAGAGSFNTGDCLQIRNDRNVTNGYDQDVFDQNITGTL